MNKNQKNKANSKEAKNMKKAKGFTLIELIAVIAILGILAVVLVPNIIGYTTKAKISKAQSDAGIIVRAIDAYEAETSEALPSTTLVTQSTVAGLTNTEATVKLSTLYYKDFLDATNGKKVIFGNDAPVKTLPKEFFEGGVSTGTTFADITIAQLRGIADRSVTITVDNAKNGALATVVGGVVGATVDTVGYDNGQ